MAVGLTRLCVVAAVLAALPLAGADESRRLFDFTPVSVGNPAVATIDGAVEISLSELRAYVQAERPQALAKESGITRKRSLLDELINEYLLVDEGYRTGVAASPEFTRRMEATRTMLLTDFLAGRELAKAVPNGSDPVTTLADRLFEAASIEVSNEAFDLLKRSAAAIDETAEASRRGPVVDSPQRASERLALVVKNTPDVVLVRYENRTITVRQLLAIYAGLPAPRPRIGTPEGLTSFIKPQIVPELMAIEAARRGIEAEPDFKSKLVQNRNILLRFRAHSLAEQEANRRLREPGLEKRLGAWYEVHRGDYAVPTDGGGSRTPSFAEVRQRVEGDYSVGLIEQVRAEKAAKLRAGRKIVVNEDALGAL